MWEYRRYPLDVNGKIVGPPCEFLAASDDEALGASAPSEAAKCELWQGGRLVARRTLAGRWLRQAALSLSEQAMALRRG